ncbi:hypothetical protein OIU84_001465 [Salix udensis]|uniref:Uncharacterized protein n=1 Tax=Salix udensis TaxID=889485 RepID=A0AAD6K7I7_9ROSI|nr:hypothetical protein OIU84_001465 [Salix udensis]
MSAPFRGSSGANLGNGGFSVVGEEVVAVEEVGLERELEMWRERVFLWLRDKGRESVEMGNGALEEEGGL